MEQYFTVFSKLAFVLLAVWVVLAGLGQTDMPGSLNQAIQRTPKQRAKGLVWANPVTSAPLCDDAVSQGAAYLQ